MSESDSERELQQEVFAEILGVVNNTPNRISLYKGHSREDVDSAIQSLVDKDLIVPVNPEKYSCPGFIPYQANI